MKIHFLFEDIEDVESFATFTISPVYEKDGDFLLLVYGFFHEAPTLVRYDINKEMEDIAIDILSKYLNIEPKFI